MAKSKRKQPDVILCPQCDTPTVGDVDRPGCRYCPKCQEPVYYNSDDDIVITTRHPEPEDARFDSLDDALEAACKPLAKLIVPHLQVIKNKPEDISA